MEFMRKGLRQSGILIILASSLAVFGTACSYLDLLKHPTPRAASPSPRLAVQTPASPQKSPTPAKAKPSISPGVAYERALDLAANATTIAESAQSPDDWSLAVSRWQEAINLLKAVPNSSPYSKNAKSKITQYQRQLADASKRAKGAKTNVPESPNKSAAKDPKAPVTVTMGESTGAEPTTAPEVFTIPIKRRSGGAPVIDVTFNGSQTFEMILDTGASNTLITKKMADALAIVPAGKTKADTASSNGVEFSFGYVSSMAAGGIVATDVQVSIAGSGLDLGLLGHDFFGKYDVTIKRDVVELQEQK